MRGRGRGMEKQVDIHCKSCGQVTPTTKWAQRFRCSRCGSKIFVDDEPRTMGSGERDSNPNYGLSWVNRNKCVLNGAAATTKELSSKTNGGPSRMMSASKGGRKKALVCGVSYKNQKYKLRGTLNDAYCMRDFLVNRWGFSPNQIRLLTEEDGGSRSIVPTKKNMEGGLGWLLDGCKAGDSLVFYFSGHGISLRESVPGDEIDFMDESLCPVDFCTEGVIRDNDLNSALVRRLPQGVTLHAIVDACHSGTILDLPWVFDTKTNHWLDNRPPSGAQKGTVNGGRAISFTACRDDQMAADTSAFTNKGMNGALTMSFIQALEMNSLDLSYHKLLVAMQDAISKSRGCKFRIILDKFLRRYFVQDPLLSSSEMFDIYTKKVQL